MSEKKILSREKRYLLPSERALGAETHAYLPELCDQLQQNKIGRRDFLRQACLLGMTATTAYAMADVLTGQSPTPVRSALAATPKGGGTIKVSMRVQRMDDPATYDWTEMSNQTRHILEYVTRTRSDNVTVPYLAKSWEASDDLKTWVFHLQDGVKWSNGDEFTSEDVAAAVTRWLDPATGSSNLGLFDAMVEEYDTGKMKDGKKVMGKRGIAGAIEVVDKHTIKFNLKKAALAMPENFYNYPTAITHRGFGKDYAADLSKNPIGTHAYEMTSFGVGERCILKRARDWWGGPLYLDEIHYYDHGEDTNAWVAAMASNQVDMIFRVPNDAVETLKRLPHVVLHEASTAQTAVMRFRVSEKPFDNKKLRQAVAACMDHEEILKVAFRGLGQVAENHHVWQGHPEYAKLPPLKRDVDKAKKLLAEAGYANGVDLTIAVGDTDGAWMTSACSVFKQQCAPAGINVNINKMPANQYWEIWDKAPWGYTTWTHRALGTMVLSLGYRAGVPWNESNYNNPDFDKALDVAEATLDVEERRKKVAVCEQLLQDDAVIPQPFWRSVYKATNKKVHGFKTHPTLYHQFEQVWMEG
ncbi:MAG: ABC transporter substrate-binding protein [Hyphomicrobiales bacterium]|nr:ABC transporter substrate-binding protein [Hyphomicrobiales bacterium]MCP5373827.1 ABC transporter substrate-binding protein [Hyphomicrobiales bacterium]